MQKDTPNQPVIVLASDWYLVTGTVSLLADVEVL
jgi:hypothetical protein